MRTPSEFADRSLPAPVGLLLGLCLLAAIWLVEQAPASAQDGEGTALLDLWVFVVDMDPATLPAVDLSDSATGELIETVAPLGSYQLPIDSGVGSLYFDLPEAWTVDGIVCVGAQGHPGGVVAEGLTVHIDYNLAPGDTMECRTAFAYIGDDGLWGDINCDARLDIVDALEVAQYVVRVRTGVDRCPADGAREIHLGRADINADGKVDVVDALEAAKCSARIAGARCSATSAWSVAGVHLLDWPREIVDLPDGTIYANTASHIERIGVDGSRSQFGDFTFGNGLHLADDGTFWATDSRGPNRVYQYDAGGAELQYFGAQGSEIGQFECPNSIHVDNGEVFVLEGDNDRIQVFDESGNYLRGWGSTGSGPGQFDVACGTASLVVVDDEVFVSDCWNRRVQVFNRDGAFDRAWSVEDAPSLWSGLCTSGITADRTGRIYLADEYSWIRVYSRDGELIETIWSSYGDWRDGVVGPTDDQRFDEVYGIHVNPEGTRLWASLNQLPQRIIVFDRTPD